MWWFQAGHGWRCSGWRCRFVSGDARYYTRPVIGELSLQLRLNEASRVGFGTVVGMAIGVAGKLAIGFAMIGLFLVKWFI
ncbi:DUF456 family protein [Geobacter metallireducens]|uniref:DUF456 family protein n=1 Tax=Geobacter metallireducens TaxID=28232 RepID=UPI0011108BD4